MASTASGNGINASSEIQTLLPIPHTHVSKKAPQFQPLSSDGNAADDPVPDIFIISIPALTSGKGRCMYHYTIHRGGANK